MAPLFHMEASSKIYPQLRAVARRIRALLSDVVIFTTWKRTRYGHGAAAASYYYRRRALAKRGGGKRSNKIASSESAWNVVEEVIGGDGTAECGYLCWLEEEEEESTSTGDGGDDGVNEIDRLAEKFIARLHARFLQEKQESYRRYQDMMARSI